MHTQSENKYRDMLDLPHPVSSRFGHMSPADRAAQFAPFAALNGFHETINAIAELTLSEAEAERTEDTRRLE